MIALKKNKDIISLLFSAIALIASLVSTYITLRHIEDVQVRIADFGISNTLDPELDSVTTHVAFINRGNRPVLVTGVEYIAIPKLDYSEGAYGGPVCSTKEGDFPFVLEKDHMKIIEFRQNAASLLANAEPGLSELHYGLRFASINSKGNEQGSEVVFAKISLDNKEVITYQSSHMAVPLLGNTNINFRIIDSNCNNQSNRPQILKPEAPSIKNEKVLQNNSCPQSSDSVAQQLDQEISSRISQVLKNLYNLTDKEKNPKLLPNIKKDDIEKALYILTDHHTNNSKPLYNEDNFSEGSLVELLKKLRERLKNTSEQHQVDQVISSLNNQLFLDMDISNIQMVAGHILEKLMLRCQWTNTMSWFIDCSPSKPFC